MELDESMLKLIAELEYRIGSCCYNPNSYDGYTEEQGCNFRYPLTIPSEYNLSGESKVRSNLRYYFEDSALYGCSDFSITEQTFLNMKYKFGSNHLYVGQGIIRALEYLEKRYAIDFCKLEEELHKTTAQ